MRNNVVLTQEENFIYTIIINRPEKHNALNRDAIIELYEKLNNLNDSSEVRVVILRGQDEKAFCSGLDLKTTVEIEEENKRVNELDLFQRLKNTIQSLRQPVIAMIYGYALGAGCDLATTCDLRIVNEGAKLGINAVKLGWAYNYDAMQRFINLVGVGYTKELLFTGRFINAQRAREIGLVNYVLPTEQLASFTYSLANEIAENAPLAVYSTKTIITEVLKYQQLSSKNVDEIQTLINETLRSKDAKEGPRAFAEKRKPRFSGS